MFTAEEWKKSGLSQKIWCNLNGIKYHRLKYWSARLKELKQKTEIFDAVRFHELKSILPIGIKISMKRHSNAFLKH